jgi:hypothetical protein
MRTGESARGRLFGVESVAPEAVKGDPPSFRIVERAVPPVIVEPEEAKDTNQQSAKNDEVERKVRRWNHGQKLARIRPSAKWKQKNAPTRLSAR